ncbi:hypothetical protein AK830_g6040 [Neonectria ditissima]|uniref:Zn(2)-C6 fungal-type domain-containing protein n=1 Tax=Neonectria ditissima TaxID=78410 RepID=A0A0P7B227_9HYPO|nr:hypothetical protein AK830_g6040 [Neonectria ditissima]
MVFPGHFSTGCLRCRQRKVKVGQKQTGRGKIGPVVAGRKRWLMTRKLPQKCDETKPSCRRCHIYGKACLGYTDQFHFRHHSPSVDLTIRPACPTAIVKRAAAASKQVQETPSPSPEKSQDADAQIVRREQPLHQAIVRQPEGSYDQISLSYFIHRFTSPDETDGFPGHLSFLPDLYNHGEHGILETATLSVAQLATYNQFGGDEFRLQSYRNYGRAIRMLQDTIQTEEQAVDDKVITAVLLLCTHKDISGEGSGDPNEHAPGLFYLLERRGPGQIATRRGAELFLLALLKLQIYSFLHEDDRYSDPGAIATVMGLFDPLLRAMSMMSRTLSLRHSLSRCVDLQVQQAQDNDASQARRHSPAREGEAILQECFEVLQDFDMWDEEAAAHWQSTFTDRTVPIALGEVASGNMYYDAETACIIILVRSARLILLLSILLYHSKMQRANIAALGDMEQWAASVEVLKQHVGKTMDDILSSVPYALGDTDANGLPAATPRDGAGAIVIVHSIRLITHCAYVTEEQLDEAKSILARMNATIGIRSAVEWVNAQSCESRWAEEQASLRSMFVANGSLPSPPSSQGLIEEVWQV